MKFAKKCLVFMMAAMMMLSMCVTVSAESKGNQEVLNARNGVVRVIYEEDDGYYMGTAFGVGEPGQETDIWVTCYHVVNPHYMSSETYESVYLTTGASLYDEIYHVDVLYADEDRDFAIMRTDRKVSGRIALPLVQSSFIEPTMQVYAMGYPGISDEVSDISYYDGDFTSLVEDQTVTAGIITKTNLVSEGVKYFQIDADINHGNSGGPSVTAHGFVIGVNTAIMADSDGGNYIGLITHIDYVMDALDDLNVSYKSVTTEEFEAAGATPTPTPVPTEVPTEETTAEPEEKGLDPMMIVLVVMIVLILVLVLVFIIYMVHRDKKREAQVAKEREQYLARRSIESYQNAQAVRGAPKVIGMQGTFANNSFTITGGMVMGRSASRCHLVFPQNTPGVSNVHCELRIVNGGLFIMDRGSSYGTFVGNQTRLNPNQPYQLHDGEVFYLAGMQNSFIVRL